jgi:WD40 repeat protein
MKIYVSLALLLIALNSASSSLNNLKYSNIIGDNYSLQHKTYIYTCSGSKCQLALSECVNKYHCYGEHQCKKCFDYYSSDCNSTCLSDLFKEEEYIVVDGKKHLVCHPSSAEQTNACKFVCRSSFKSFGMCILDEEYPLCKCSNTPFPIATTTTSSSSTSTTTRATTTPTTTTTTTTPTTTTTTTPTTTTTTTPTTTTTTASTTTAQLPPMLEGHTDWVLDIVALDDFTLASASADKSIIIWNLVDGTVRRRLLGHDQAVSCLKVLNESKLASGSWDYSIKIWDTRAGVLIKTLNGHTNMVSSLAVFYGYLVSSAWDNTIRIWEIDQGSLTRTISAHNSWVNSIAAMNNYIVSVGDDNSIKFWDFFGTLSKNIYVASNNVWTVAALNSTHLACSKESNAISIYSNTFETYYSWNHSLTMTLNGHTRPVSSIVSLEPNELASGSEDNTIILWNTETGRQKRTLVGHTQPVRALTLLRKGVLISASQDRTIRIWHL